MIKSPLCKASDAREHIYFHDFASLKELQAENATQNQF